MTDVAGGAAAPAADISSAAPGAAIEHVAAPPTPISDSGPAAGEAAIEPKPAPTAREALKAAAAKVEKDEAAKVDPKAAATTTEQPRDKGKFAAKDATGKEPAAAKLDAAGKPIVDKTADGKADAKAGVTAVTEPKAGDVPAAKTTHAAPARFSNDAKAVWDTAPEPVKAEVTRMQRELEQGIEKHRVKAERDDQIADFHELAKKSGTDVKTALTKYTNMEQLLRTNPLKGLEAVCDNIGVSIKDVARIVLGQAPDQEASQSEATIRGLRQELSSLKEQVGGITNTFKQQGETQLHEQIATWAEKIPLFEVLAPHIAQEMRDGAANLDAAHEAVLQKYPQLAALSDASKSPPAKEEPEIPAAASSAAAPDLSAQTRKGSKSITGAPGDGSEPVARQPSSSIKEALKRAAAKAG